MSDVLPAPADHAIDVHFEPRSTIAAELAIGTAPAFGPPSSPVVPNTVDDENAKKAVTAAFDTVRYRHSARL